MMEIKYQQQNRFVHIKGVIMVKVKVRRIFFFQRFCGFVESMFDSSLRPVPFPQLFWQPKKSDKSESGWVGPSKSTVTTAVETACPTVSISIPGIQPTGSDGSDMSKTISCSSVGSRDNHQLFCLFLILFYWPKVMYHQDKFI